MADRSVTGVLAERLLRVVTQLLERYAQEARVEAERDLKRLVTGLVALVLAALLSLHAVAFAHMLAVVGLIELGVPAPQVLMGVLGVDLVSALLCILFGRVMLTRPLLPKTRAHFGDLQQAVHLLTG